MGHGTEHRTDPRVYRLHVRGSSRSVLFAWDYPGASLLQVRILRSQSSFPESPDDDGAVVFDGASGSFRDIDVSPGRRYYYGVWARPAQSSPATVEDRSTKAPGQTSDDPWTLWALRRVRACDPPRVQVALARLAGVVGLARGRRRESM